MQEVKIFAHGQDSGKVSVSITNGNTINIDNKGTLNLTIVQQSATPASGNENSQNVHRKGLFAKIISFLSALHLAHWLIDFIPWVLLSLLPLLIKIVQSNIPPLH